ncbi:MAG: hypothetical protein ACC726_16890 [Chloroflexota bacterium]
MNSLLNLVSPRMIMPLAASLLLSWSVAAAYPMAARAAEDPSSVSFMVFGDPTELAGYQGP